MFGIVVPDPRDRTLIFQFLDELNDIFNLSSAQREKGLFIREEENNYSKKIDTKQNINLQQRF